MRRILYVEDEKDTADAVKTMLEIIGNRVDTANTGNEGITLIKRNPYDLILLDIMLPDMSGWDIYNSIRGGQKVAFLSAIPISSERREELRKSGVKDYITKPFTKKDLIERVQRILN